LGAKKSRNQISGFVDDAAGKKMIEKREYGDAAGDSKP